MSDLTITFQGTSAAVPTPKRGLSALTVQRGADFLLFDCGEGTQRQMMKTTGLKAPTAVFITHAHGDHWTGLPGLVASLDMRDVPPEHVMILAPGNMIAKIRIVLERTVGMPSFIDLVPIAPEGTTVDRMVFNEGTRDEFTVTPFPTVHSKESQGYVLTEPDRPGRFEPFLALGAGIEPGPDFKRLQNGETVKGLKPEDVIGPARKGRKIAYTGDTSPFSMVVDAAKGADVLIHEATFEEEQASRALKTRHSTGAGAARVALDAQVKRLVLTHFSPRVNPKVVVSEAAAVFSPVEAAHDGMSLSIPLED